MVESDFSKVGWDKADPILVGRQFHEHGRVAAVITGP